MEAASNKTFLDLPSEILVEVLTYLSPFDRRIISSVCKIIHETWLHPIFDDDRRLVFKNCLITSGIAPHSIFTQTHNQYRYLVLQDVVLRGDTSELWSTLGKTVTHIETGQINGINSILNHFLNLKDLHIDYASYDTPVKQSIPTEICSKLYSLTLELPCNFDPMKFDYNTISQFTNLKSLTLKIDYSSEPLNQFLNIHHSILTHLHVSVNDTSQLAECVLPELKHLVVHTVGPAIDCHVLSSVLERSPKLEYLEVFTSEFPEINLKQLKYLLVQTVDRSCFSLVNSFTGLQELGLICFNYKNCYFGHALQFNGTVKRLTANSGGVSTCIDCFKNLVNSMPHVEEFSTNLILSADHFKLIQESFKKLRKLEATECEETISQEILCLNYITNLTDLHLSEFQLSDAIARDWPLMPNLRTLKIDRLMEGIHENSFSNMMKNLPLLEVIEFSGPITKEMVAVIGRTCKRLKALTITELPERVDLSVNDMEILLKNCEYIQEISLPINVEESDHGAYIDQISKLFTSRSSLKKIHTGLSEIREINHAVAFDAKN